MLARQRHHDQTKNTNATCLVTEQDFTRRQQAREQQTHMPYGCVPMAMISSTIIEKASHGRFVVNTLTAQPLPYCGNACLTTSKNHKYCM